VGGLLLLSAALLAYLVSSNLWTSAGQQVMASELSMIAKEEVGRPLRTPTTAKMGLPIRTPATAEMGLPLRTRTLQNEMISAVATSPPPQTKKKKKHQKANPK
jgi:hypothetical protein